MKIQWVVNSITQIGGIERVICNLSDYFISRGMQTEIVSLGSCSGNAFFPLSSEVKITHLGKTLDSRKAYVESVKEAIPVLDGDIIIACHTVVSNALIAFKWKIKGKLIITQHCCVDFNSKLRNEADAFLWRFADKLVLLTDYDKNFFTRRGLKNCMVMPNAVNAVREGEPDLSSPVIITAGRLTAVKGYDFLIKAFAEFHENHPEWRLRILGDGEEMQKLRQTAVELGIENCVELPGFTKEVMKEFSKASMFAMTSHTEGFPMILLEAMYAGLPVVTVNLPVSEEILDCGSGMIVPRDEHLFAQALSKLAEDRSVREQFAAKGRNRIEKYSLEEIGSSWIRLFEEMLRM